MTTFTLYIDNPKDVPCLDWIEKGIKPVEGRPYSPKYHKIKPGDLVLFRCGQRSLTMKVSYVKLYPSVKAYLETETVKRALPGVKTVEEGIAIYNRWTAPEKREGLRKKHGFGFMGIGVVPNVP